MISSRKTVTEEMKKKHMNIHRYGRKTPLMVSVILQLLSGVGCAVVPWFYALLLMKFLSALATGGTMVTSYVICT